MYSPQPPAILIHETDPWTAITIARSGIALGGPILGDAGLNCWIQDDERGSFNSDQAERKGALMFFEWSGPVATDGYRLIGAPDVLYDQRPHRAIVFVESTKHLRLATIQLIGGSSYEDLVVRPTFPTGQQLLYPSSWVRWVQSKRAGWVAGQAKVLQADLDSLLQSRPAIRIAAPRDASYHFVLCERAVARSAQA